MWLCRSQEIVFALYTSDTVSYDNFQLDGSELFQLCSNNSEKFLADGGAIEGRLFLLLKKVTCEPQVSGSPTSQVDIHKHV